MHSDEPGSAANEPAWQLEHVATPCELAADENFPAGHWAHDVLPVADEKLPARQSRHDVAFADTLYWPAAHGKHCESGGTRLYEPGAHDVQTVAPTPPAMVPGKQRRHAVCPELGLNEPMLH